MWFDLTKTTALEAKKYQQYKRWQNFLYLFAVLTAAYLSFKILFPSQFFEFSFNNSSTKSNTVSFVNINNSGKLQNDLMKKDATLSFAASSPSLFSKALVQFELDKKSQKIDTGKIIVRKSYQAFFYPEGNPVEIETYLHTRSQQQFGDGSLVSYGNSIYVVNNNQVMPIDSSETFLALGYAWENVLSIDADLFSAYTKGSLLTLYSAHPNGTVFQTDTDKKYIIRNGKKYPLPSDFTATAAVRVSEKSFALSADCQLQKDVLTFRKYSCDLPLDRLQDIPGKDYLMTAEFSNDIQLQNIFVELKKDATIANLKLSLSNLIKRSKENYVPTISNQ